MKSIFFVVFLAIASGCGTFHIPKESDATNSTKESSPELYYLGAYDSRVQLGEIETHKDVTTYQAQPMYGSRGYAGTLYYPQTTKVRTGEIAPNDIVKAVAIGFDEYYQGREYFKNLNSTTPIEARNEMGMEWFANHGEYRGYLISVEVKNAKLDLESARSTSLIGGTAIVLGVLSPLLCFTTAPCLLALPFLTTTVTGNADAVIHVYGVQEKNIVARIPVDVTMSITNDGFYNDDTLYASLANELGTRLGKKASLEIERYFHQGAS